MSRPEKKFKCGPLAASVFVETRVINGEMVKLYSIIFDKAYKEGAEWKHTHSFATEDLLKIAILADAAYRYLRLRSADDVDGPDS